MRNPGKGAPKHKTIARPPAGTSTTPNRAVSRGGSSTPSSPTGGAVGVGSAGRSGSPSRKKRSVIVPKKKSVSGGRRGVVGSGATDPMDVVTASLKPAYDELTRQETIAGRTRDLQVQDANALRDWLAKDQGDAEAFLAAQIDKARAAFAPPSSANLDAAQAAAQQATGGNADISKASGVDAAQGTQAAYRPATQAMISAPELNSGAFLSSLVAGRGVNSARQSNVQSSINAGYNTRLSDLTGERSKLALTSADLQQKERANVAQQAQDAKTFQLLAREKMGKLAVAQTNAKTQRLQVITTAENARQTLRLKGMVEAGKATREEARLELQRSLQSQNLSIAKQKLELARFDSQTKRLKATGSDVSKISDYVSKRYSDYLDQFGGVGPTGARVPAQWDAIPGDQQRKIVRTVITAMRGHGGAGLTQDQALSILGGVFGDIPVRDPSFRNMVTALWPR